MRVVLIAALAGAVGCHQSLIDKLHHDTDGGSGTGGGHEAPPAFSPTPVVGKPQPAPVDPNPTAPLGPDGGKLDWTNAPLLGDVQFVPNRDSVVLRLPAVANAFDYRAIILDKGVGVASGSDGSERVTGATIVCAGYLQRNTRRPTRELLNIIELPGLAGATRVTIEALDGPCPYTCVIGTKHDTISRTTEHNHEISAADSGTYAIYTEDEVVQTFGSAIFNGQGPATTQSGQPAAATPPKVLARTTVKVTPSGNQGTPPASTFFDDFATADPPVLISDGTTCYPSQGCMHPYIDILQNQKWTFEPAGMDKAQYFYDRGQLHSVAADGGSLGFASAVAYPRQLAHVDATNYLHITFEASSLTTQRRYWWISVCGADQPGKTINADGSPASFLHPDSSLQLADGNNPNLSGFSCFMVFPKDGNYIFPLPLGDGTMAPPETETRVLIYKSGTGVTGVNVSPDQYKNGWISPSWFRMMDGAGNLVGPMLDADNLYHVTTRFDLYVRKGRVVLYADGQQKLCNDFAPSLTSMSEAMVGFGQVLYHTSAEQNELAITPGDPNNDVAPRMRHVYENLKYFDRRDWDNLGFDDGIGPPVGFDESACYKSDQK
jgi:hypothetical protein